MRCKLGQPPRLERAKELHKRHCPRTPPTRLDLTGQKDRLGHWSLAQYNSLQQLTLITNRNGNVTSLGYCLCGGLDSVTDPLGNNTTYNRNLAGWVTSAVYTGNGGNQTTRTYNRDAWGRTTNLVDSAGLNLTYTLNMQGLATNISSSAGTVVRFWSPPFT